MQIIGTTKTSINVELNKPYMTAVCSKQVVVIYLIYF